MTRSPIELFWTAKKTVTNTNTNDNEKDKNIQRAILETCNKSDSLEPEFITISAT